MERGFPWPVGLLAWNICPVHHSISLLIFQTVGGLRPGKWSFDLPRSHRTNLAFCQSVPFLVLSPFGLGKVTCLVSEASAQPLLSAPGKGDGFTMVCCGEYQVRKFWGDSVRRARCVAWDHLWSKGNLRGASFLPVRLFRSPGSVPRAVFCTGTSGMAREPWPPSLCS